MNRATQSVILLALSICRLHGQSTTNDNATKEAPDELIFVDGERLLGHMERSGGDSVTFKSDMAGEITVPWTKVKSLHSDQRFAVVPKGVKFGRHRDTDRIPKGEISVADQNLKVTGGTTGQQTLPVRDAGYVIDEPTFEKSLRRPGLFEAWKGSATAGISLVLATQKDRTYTSGITLSRAIPGEAWMNPENRTTFDFASSYGELTQPGQPLTKTSIFHADAERDEYFKPRLYGFTQAAFDHNYSQGLDLEETVGAGMGWTVIKGTHEQLDLKAELTYVKQQFQQRSQNQNLAGALFAESYDHEFKHSILFHEALSISPAFNNTRAYSAFGNVSFTVPITKHLSIALNSLDTFLNNPSPGFKKNSFQYTTGLSYSLP